MQEWTLAYEEAGSGSCTAWATPPNLSDRASKLGETPHKTDVCNHIICSNELKIMRLVTIIMMKII
jgi:hypothetical protein